MLKSNTDLSRAAFCSGQRSNAAAENKAQHVLAEDARKQKKTWRLNLISKSFSFLFSSVRASI